MKPNKAPDTAGKPTLVPWQEPAMSTPRPTISSVVSDPDGDAVSIRVRIVDRVGETVWEGYSTEVPSGSVARVKVPRGILAVGSRYRVSVMASDGVLDAAAWSETQAFLVVPPRQLTRDREATVESDDVVSDDPALRNVSGPPPPEGGAWFTRDRGREVRLFPPSLPRHPRDSFYWDSVCTDDEHEYEKVMDYRRERRHTRMVGDVARMYCGKESRYAEAPYSEAARGHEVEREGDVCGDEAHDERLGTSPVD